MSNTPKHPSPRRIKREVKYFFVSKRVYDVPIFDEEGKFTHMERRVQVKGDTYRKPKP